MNIARQIAKYEEKGFSRERAEINALMENAILAIFRDFPAAFLVFGGATLVLFHESVRHSADLDLLARGTSLPTRDEIVSTLKRELSPIAQILQLGELQFGSAGSGAEEGSIFVSSSSGQRFFRVDLTKQSSVRLSKAKLKRTLPRHSRANRWRLRRRQRSFCFCKRRKCSC
jgi:hypothetical protein